MPRRRAAPHDKGPHDKGPPPLCVKIVSANEETLDGLEAYLREAGIVVHPTRELEGARTKGPAPNAIVFFPDEFATEDALRVMVRAHRQRPAVRLVVVTHHRKRFADAFDADEGLVPVIIPKPAWGWTILEAIRGGQEP